MSNLTIKMGIWNNFLKKRNNLQKFDNFYFFLISAIVFFIDRYSKSEIINNFSDRTYFINSYINFDLIWNTGIGFGFLSTESALIYNLVTLLIGLVVLFLGYTLFISERLDKLIYSIIIGGGLGNFYDRIFYKAVPDFIDLHYNNFHWFTFNVADIFITVAIITFILRSFFIKN